MVDLTLDEKIYVFENRIRLLSTLLKACEIDQNINVFGFELVGPFDPENPKERLQKGVQDARPVESIISEAEGLWQDIKNSFVNGIRQSDWE